MAAPGRETSFPGKQQIFQEERHSCWGPASEIPEHHNTAFCRPLRPGRRGGRGWGGGIPPLGTRSNTAFQPSSRCVLKQHKESPAIGKQRTGVPAQRRTLQRPDQSTRGSGRGCPPGAWALPSPKRCALGRGSSWGREGHILSWYLRGRAVFWVDLNWPWVEFQRHKKQAWPGPGDRHLSTPDSERQPLGPTGTSQLAGYGLGLGILPSPSRHLAPSLVQGEGQEQDSTLLSPLGGSSGPTPACLCGLSRAHALTYSRRPKQNCRSAPSRGVALNERPSPSCSEPQPPPQKMRNELKGLPCRLIAWIRDKVYWAGQSWAFNQGSCCH